MVTGSPYEHVIVGLFGWFCPDYLGFYRCPKDDADPSAIGLRRDFSVPANVQE